MDHSDGIATLPKDWNRRRGRVLRRDRRVCRSCGGLFADEVVTIVSVLDGGTYDEANLASVHEGCPRPTVDSTPSP